ncbi:hypothetical protein [Schaalia odontolytica]|uniref:hypothetical protein n=1 Tax=Schaalia odontolytica TaxID=1660 RepID=UPI0028D06AC6|nr:hypothetical protein [Schaalia odontolytica]
MNPRTDEQLHTAVLVAPAKERRRLAKQRRRAAAALVAEQKKDRMDQAKARQEAARAEARATTYLPAEGEPGPAGLRSPGRFRLPRHQDTSAMLADAYPFLAEGGLGSRRPDQVAGRRGDPTRRAVLQALFRIGVGNRSFGQVSNLPH